MLNRDFRLEDQTALGLALKEADELAVVWIYEEGLEGIPWVRRWESHGLRTRLEAFLRFQEALNTIGQQAFLCLLSYDEALAHIRQFFEFEKIFLNRGYDQIGRALSQAARRAGVPVEETGDGMIFEPERILKKDGTSYQMFTPYYRQWLQAMASEPPVSRMTIDNDFPTSVKLADVPGMIFIEALEKELKEDRPQNFHHGLGRRSALKGFTGMRQHLQDFLSNGLATYEALRDLPAVDGTSGMSVYLNTGMLSPRQFVGALLKTPGHETLLRQYVWREFYLQLAHHQPHVLTAAMRPEFASLEWERSPFYFEAWKNGETGVPLVDAAMKALAAEGKLHNRLRMVAASYLVKDLHVNWQQGEAYFRDMLADYEPALNNGGWQWCASTGTDAQPYFRVFNPWQQSLKFDPEAVFMKRWLPGFAQVEAKKFHQPGGLTAYGYPDVIVDHAEAVRMTKALYQQAKERYLKQIPHDASE